MPNLEMLFQKQDFYFLDEKNNQPKWGKPCKKLFLNGVLKGSKAWLKREDFPQSHKCPFLREKTPPTSPRSF